MAVRSRYVPMITEHEPRIGGSPDIDKKIRNMNPRRLSDEDRLERLMALRQEKAGKRASRIAAWIAESAPKPFEPYFSEADVLRARGLGIRLD